MTNTDPIIMQHLIVHAQAALELTSDPMLVELIFQRLRKEAADRASTSKLLLENRPKPAPKRRAIKYTMTPAQMNRAIDELNEAAPHTPVFVLFLYSRGFLNQAALATLKEAKFKLRMNLFKRVRSILDVGGTDAQAETVTLEPGAAAARILDQLTEWGYLGEHVDDGSG